jgi:hypothetical protein
MSASGSREPDLAERIMDNAAKRQSKRVNEPAHAPAAPGRDVLLALATAWSTSHGSPRPGGVLAVVTPPAAPLTFGVAASVRRTSR